MSQEQFANLFGVSRQSVQKWETGESTPDIEKLVKLKVVIDIRYSFINVSCASGFGNFIIAVNTKKKNSESI